MTLINVANCLALTFLPPWMVFKSKLEDYATGPLGFNAGCVYMAAQVFQIYLTATFVPVMEEDTFSVVQELVKAIISLVDVLAFLYLFQSKKTAHAAAFCGLAWSMTENIVSRFMPLVLQANSMQFSWRHIISSLEANVGIVTHMCFALLVWMYVRRPQLKHSIVVTIIVQRFTFPLVSRYLAHSMPDQPFVAVGAEAAMALLLALVVKGMFSSLERSRA